MTPLLRALLLALLVSTAQASPVDSDAFTGADNSAPSSRWTVGNPFGVSTTGGVAAIFSNALGFYSANTTNIEPAAYTSAAFSLPAGSWVGADLLLVSYASAGTGVEVDTEMYLFDAATPANWHRIVIAAAGTSATSALPASVLVYCQKHLAGGSPTTIASVTYSATQHAHLRLRNLGGNVICEGSPDASTWTAIGSATSPAGAVLSSAKVAFGVAPYATSGYSVYQRGSWDNYIRDDGVLGAGTATALTLSCSPASVAAGGTSTCTVGTNGTIAGTEAHSAALTATGGSFGTTPVVLNSTTATATSLYTAPAGVGSYTLTATDTASGGAPTLTTATTTLTVSSISFVAGTPHIRTVLTGTGTSWSGSTTFTVTAADSTSLTVVSSTNVSATVQNVSFDPAGHGGPYTISDGSRTATVNAPNSGAAPGFLPGRSPFVHH